MRSSHLYIVEGIVLKRQNVGEADRILTVFTKQYGKIRVIAKGVRRITSRRAGHIEVFSHVILTLHVHANLDIVTEAQTKVGNTFSTTHVERAGYAYCICELVDQLLADHQEHEDVFVLLRDGLAAVSSAAAPHEWQETIGNFVHQLLWILGFLPSSRQLREGEMRMFVERITERKLRAWPLLTVLGGSS